MCFVNELLGTKFLFCIPLSVVMYMIELDYLGVVMGLLVCYLV